MPTLLTPGSAMRPIQSPESWHRCPAEYDKCAGKSGRDDTRRQPVFLGQCLDHSSHHLRRYSAMGLLSVSGLRGTVGEEYVLQRPMAGHYRELQDLRHQPVYQNAPMQLSVDHISPYSSFAARRGHLIGSELKHDVLNCRWVALETVSERI